MTAGQGDQQLTGSAGEASRLVRRILTSARELERRFDECLAAHGLNLTRADVLTTIAGYGEAGCSQTDLASALQLSESNICTLVERMQTDGWLFRLRSQVDRRRCVVVLSPQGLATFDEIEQLRRARTTTWLRDLSPGELTELNALLDRFLMVLAARSPVESAALRRRPGRVSEELRRAS